MTRLPLFPAGPPPAAVDSSPALRQNPSCTRCDLHQTAIKRCLPPAAVTAGTGGLLVVSPYPDRVANATAQVWSDRAHRQALTAIQRRWRGPLALATALGCFPDGKAEAKHTAKCRPYLRSWIDQVQPSRIVLLGTLAAWGALGRSVPARSVRRGFTWVSAPAGRVPALMLMDPAVLDGRHAWRAWEDDLEWALSTADAFFESARQFMTEATYEVVGSVQEARDAVAYLRAWYQRTGRPISWDVESRGKMHNADFRVVSAALCGTLDNRAFVWDRRALESPEVARELWDLLDDPHMHFTEQGSYDERAKLCVTGRDIAGLRDDVRLLRKLADVEVQEADLDTLSELVGFGGYKAEFAKDLEAAEAGVKPSGGKRGPSAGVWSPRSPLLFDDCPDREARATLYAIYASGSKTAASDAKSYLYALVPPARLSLYNARDAVATGLLREVCYAPVQADPALLQLWREVTQPASRSYTTSEHWGVPMSRHAISALIQYGEMQKAQIAPQLRAHLSPEFKDIDLDSRDQVATFLFTPREMGGLGLSPPKRTEKAGKDALDEEAKKALHGAHPFVDLWIAYTALDAEVEKGQEFARYLREDGCAHPAILLDGTRTGRPACVAKGTYIETLRDAATHPRGIPIEDVREGDLVYCYDEKGQLRIRPVVAAMRSGVKAVVRVRWQGSGHQHVGHIDLTPDHLVKLTDGRWLPAGELKPGDRVFALKRGVGSGGYARLWATGNVEVTREHRFVFKEVYGFEPKVVHHVNENKLDNRPINLEATNKEDHGRHHGIENAARKGPAFYSQHFQALWRDRRDDMLAATRKGAEKSRLDLSREEVIAILERNEWSMTRVRDVDGYDYETFQRYAVDAGLSIEEIKKRAENIARAQGRGKGRYKRVKPRVYICRNCGQSGHYKTTCPELVPNNHEIVSVEPLTEPAEVYDLSVAGVHSFIANEICVHNCIAPNVYNMKRPEDHEPCKGKGCSDCGETGADASSQLIRACFSAPSEDFVICEIDLSQIEIRGIAALSRDPVLTEAYVRKEDVHSFVASHGEPLGVPLTRSDAKPVIFGKGYGQMAVGLAKNLKLKRERGESYADYTARKLVVAERIYNVVSQILRGTETHRAQVIAEAKRLGYSYNLWRGVPSQRRPLWDLDSRDNRARIHAENAAYSTLIQGSMSGLLVLASHARLVEMITSRGFSHLWRPVVCVYDSIIAVMHKAIVPLAARVTVDVMTSWVIGHLADGRPFPLEADCKLGRNLAVAKKYKPPATYREALAECQALGLYRLLGTEQTNRIAREGALL